MLSKEIMIALNGVSQRISIEGKIRTIAPLLRDVEVREVLRWAGDPYIQFLSLVQNDITFVVEPSAADAEIRGNFSDETWELLEIAANDPTLSIRSLRDALAEESAALNSESIDLLTHILRKTLLPHIGLTARDINDLARSELSLPTDIIPEFATRQQPLIDVNALHTLPFPAALEMLPSKAHAVNVELSPQVTGSSVKWLTTIRSMTGSIMSVQPCTHAVLNACVRLGEILVEQDPRWLTQGVMLLGYLNRCTDHEDAPHHLHVDWLHSLNDYHKARCPHDYDYVKQRQCLHNAVRAVNAKELNFRPHYTVNSAAEAFRFFTQAKNIGEKGVIIQRFDNPCDFVSRDTPADHARVMLTEAYSATATIVDIIEGEGVQSGRVGGLIVNYQGRDYVVDQGMSDEIREQLWEEPEDFIDTEIIVGTQHDPQQHGTLKNAYFKQLVNADEGEA